MHHPVAGELMEAALRALIRIAPAAVMTLDQAGRITGMNPPAERLFSATADRAFGQTYEAVLGASLAARLPGLFLRTMRAGGDLEPQVVRATLPDGRRVELRANVGPIKDAGGRTEELLFVAEELTEGAPAANEVTDRLRLALKRYLGEDIATMVETRPSFIGVGGVRRQVSVVHADMRGYTTRAEQLPPEETIHLLLKYHGRAVEALQAAGATLDRFIGDAVLAIWNAPHDYEGHAEGALRGALALQRAARETGNELAYGIGVHTGDAVVGNIGSPAFMNYTAVGDTVNLAARLQAEAAPGQVLCSRRVIEEAGGRFEARSLGPITVRGRAEPIDVMELLGGSEGGVP